MSKIQAVTPNRHAGKRWRRYNDYSFASRTAIAPLAAAELTQAALALPLALVQQSGHWTLAAVLGFSPKQNLFVDANGNWHGRYIPATFRGYPFLIGAKPNGEPALCFDEASGLLTDGADGEAFFEDGGALSPSVTQVSNFLAETARQEAVLMQGCDFLSEAGVIEAWPITVRGEHGAQQVDSLFRINEAAFNGLDDAVFGVLRRNGALGIAYAQLISMGNLNQLGQLAQARAQAEAAERAKAEVKPIINLPNDNTIDWDWSKIGR